MDIKVGGLSYTSPMRLTDTNEKIEKPQMPFSEFLKNSIYNVSDSQKHTQELTDLLIAGKLDNLHDLTIAAEVSSVNFQALVEVKNRVIDAYKEIMRIQV
ncbi:Flagellar hook-basal body complex protein FliE [bioreactor metagenome]|jgi:flagellar hook-basal body complex protein FliE|uniref:Flagellar hook-basal body complex protein FliE n=1 Tax=bioreactor metagenome TaxID=1076179 RepID=A0A645HJC7_9ZZZZ|nr:flagellar hook-basal body complex protein FliE [Acetoanaerobium noterae]MBP8762820.1 flagellar hook-basal body complex protein FliE [Acetoanaerobium sp.]MBP9499808.1 flagellar hook-basal body complex protein FliE [Acetoanaerobium sp.]MBP9562427.1 flagellar hook-basal body complex protein FliE [Acetoanaerobium sp.]MDK2803674.1 flagellar hook-basal body complex protein FliE [Peptostreptococcaceae bacterium]